MTLEITRREIMFSTIIFLVMVAIGFLVAGSVEEKVHERSEVYFKSLKIDDDPEIFDYALSTNVGPALVSGTITANEPVTFPEIVGEFYAIKKITERYTMHTRTVTTRVNGKTQTREETYYTWDHHGSSVKNTDTITFLEKTFPATDIKVYASDRLKLSKENTSGKQKNWIRGNYIYEGGDFLASVGDLRYYYKIRPKSFQTSLFTIIRNNTINESVAHPGKSIKQVIDSKQKDAVAAKIVTWILWIILTFGVMYAFVYFENRWLED